jgi:hypothetical protein
MAINFHLEICLNLHIFELFICGDGAPYTSVHILADAGEREVKLLENWNMEHKVFCLDLLVLNKVLVMKAENDFLYVFSWLGMSICYSSSISVLLYMYIHNCVHIMFKIWYMTIILSNLLLCDVNLMQGFIYEKMLLRNYNYSQEQSFLTGNEENPALVLSNVHNRPSARDGPCSALWASP